MMLRLDLTPEIEAGLQAQARAEGLTLEQFLNRIFRGIAQSNAQTIPQHSDEWERSFRAWVRTHPTNTPLLSDEAISRELIYRVRGL
jgi:hypothetical protein